MTDATISINGGPEIPLDTMTRASNAVAGDRIRAFLERWERLDEERKAIVDDQKEVLAEAKGEGFDVKILRKIIALRKMDRDKRREEEEILELYLSALGEQLSLI